MRPIETLATVYARACGIAIAEALDRFQGNKSDTARALGISRRHLYLLMEKYGIRSQWVYVLADVSEKII